MINDADYNTRLPGYRIVVIFYSLFISINKRFLDLIMCVSSSINYKLLTPGEIGQSYDLVDWLSGGSSLLPLPSDKLTPNFILL